MVRKPVFMIIANGIDVTLSIAKNLIELSLTDEANENADELRITIAGKFARPQYKDILKLYLGYDDNYVYMGSFQVQSTTRGKNHLLSICATGVNFNDEMKEKRDITYEKISIKQICSQIADRSGLKLKSDFDDIYVASQAQSNESDLHFLNRLSKEYNAIFNVKNDTLIFTKKIKDEVKNEILPTYEINADNCENFSIKHSNKTSYKSCKCSWHSTKDNETKYVTVGTGKPCLHHKGNFKNAAEAKEKATAKLQTANQGIITGSLSKEGEVIFAGGVFTLINTLEDDGEYQIKTVEHTVDGNGGWNMSINFEK